MLPVRVAPVAGEAIDSWLEALARSLDLSLGQLFGLLGISRRRHQALVRRLAPAEIAILVEGTRVPAPELLAMTLSRHDGTATELDGNTGLVNQSFPFAARAGSRYCPECLAETVGRWQLQWRLGWSFVCVRATRGRRGPGRGAALANASAILLRAFRFRFSSFQSVRAKVRHRHHKVRAFA
jgi:hypothetical protein